MTNVTPLRHPQYNQEQCRVTSYNGKSSLIRSFP